MMKKIIAKTILPLFVLLLTALLIFAVYQSINIKTEIELYETTNEKRFIKYVEFNPTYAVLSQALEYDLKTYKQDIHLNWIELLAYCGAKNNGDFSNIRSTQLDRLAKQLLSGKTMQELSKDLKYYSYYYEVYNAVLNQFLGEYTIEVYDENQLEQKTELKKYGLKNFSPIADGYDLITGAPLIASEGGIVESLGWSKDDGWHIEIRSIDRYYIYSNLRSKHPFVKTLKAGDTVKAGDVIGYLGNGKSYFKLQLVFDASQKNDKIHIETGELLLLLENNKSEVIKKDLDYVRKFCPVSKTSDNNEKIKLPIIMYHSILKDTKRSGKYVVTPQTVESDMVYLKNNGYTTINMTELIEYVKNDAELPDKPVIITLDDGNLNNLTYLLPLLQKHNMKAVISVVGEYIERYSGIEDKNPSYSYLSWSDLTTLVDSGHVEIQNHSYNMHELNGRRGAMKKSTETMSQYREIFIADALKNQQLLLKNCGIVPNTYTYPYGQITKETVGFLNELGFDAALTCYEYVNEIGKTSDLMQLGRFNRPSGISTEGFMRKALG